MGPNFVIGGYGCRLYGGGSFGMFYGEGGSHFGYTGILFCLEVRLVLKGESLASFKCQGLIPVVQWLCQ